MIFINITNIIYGCFLFNTLLNELNSEFLRLPVMVM